MINLVTLPIATLLLLLLQAMFAGSEISLLSCDKGKIRSKADKGLASAKLVTQSINKIEEYVATSLVGENLCIVINTVLVSSFIEKTYPDYDPHLLSVLILTPLIVIFGQVIPKSVFQKKSNSFVLKTIYFSLIFSFLFKPLLFLVRFLTNIIVKIIGTKSKLITREELIHALETESAVENSSQQFRDKILNQIFLFDTVKVRDIMIPIDSVAAIDLNSNVADATRLIEETGFSRFPIYDTKKNQIKGIVHAFYLLGRSGNELVSKFADDCFFVEENYLASRLLDELKESKSSLAIVGTSKNAVGIVTVEDILEEVLGEIEDEHDM